MIVVIRNKFPWQHEWAERAVITSHAFPLVQRLRDKKSYKLICKTVCDKKTVLQYSTVLSKNSSIVQVCAQNVVVWYNSGYPSSASG